MPSSRQRIATIASITPILKFSRMVSRSFLDSRDVKRETSHPRSCRSELTTSICRLLYFISSSISLSSDSTVPSNADNTSGFESDASRFAIWQNGRDEIPVANTDADSIWNCLPNNQRWASTSFVTGTAAGLEPFVPGGGAG